jgi:4-amino-4-deoxychorismate lyase
MPVESAVRSRGDHTFGLIETLRYEPGQGCIRAERHLDRMADSARHFERAFDRSIAARLLAAITSATRLRVRLFLDPADSLTCATHDFTPVPDGAVWKLAIAKSRLESADTFLAHKTSRRGGYDAARAEFSPSHADEVLMENETRFLCEGTITTLFVRQSGKLITPRLSHGLLRGVLRQEMLNNGLAIEGDLRRSDLIGAELFVGNSLRGLIPAKLVERA